MVREGGCSGEGGRQGMPVATFSLQLDILQYKRPQQVRVSAARRVWESECGTSCGRSSLTISSSILVPAERWLSERSRYRLRMFSVVSM